MEMSLKEDYPIHFLKASHVVLSHHALNPADKLQIDLAKGILTGRNHCSEKENLHLLLTSMLETQLV